MKISLPGFRTLSVGSVILLAILAAVIRIFGSGGSDCEDLDCRSFFSPGIIQSPHERPFFFRDNTFYEPFTLFRPFPPAKDPPVQAVNLEEWAAYFGPAVPKAELSNLIYKVPAEDVANTAAPLFQKYANKDRVTKALEYLLLAKRVEPIATRSADQGWQGNVSAKPLDMTLVQELIDSAEKKIPQSDKFLAERYRLQVMRLLYYSSRYADAQNYFEQFKNSFAGDGSPKYRFMDLAAGAYYNDEKFGKANYLFSVVFDKFLPLRRSSYFSFHPMEDGDWNETLALAKNVHEREVLWQLLGIYADGMAAIENIYKLNPKSELLPLLVVREVNKTEHDWTANQDLYRNRLFIRTEVKSDLAAVGTMRLARLKMIADTGNTTKPYLWRLAVGHLLALAGDSRMAETYIAMARKSMPNVPEIQEQARMSQLFARTRAIRSIDRSVEPYLASEFEWLRNSIDSKRGANFRADNLNWWALGYLSQIYQNGSDPVRALMLTDSTASPLYGTVDGIEMILAFKRSPATSFDKFLVKNYKYSIEELQELGAIKLLYSGDLTNAAETFKLAGENAQRELKADPFMIHIKDCHECDFKAPHTKYTKVTFADRMLALSRASQGQGDEAAQASFELANGFYNMSFYGNGREIFDTHHHNFYPDVSSLYYGPVFPSNGNPNSEIVFNMDLAEKYYVQTMNLFSNKENKTKAAFMAAKTEQNRFFDTHRDGKGDQPWTYFKLLKDSYSDTQYYREIINECGTFRAYIAR